MNFSGHDTLEAERFAILPRNPCARTEANISCRCILAPGPGVWELFDVTVRIILLGTCGQHF